VPAPTSRVSPLMVNFNDISQNFWFKARLKATLVSE